MDGVVEISDPQYPALLKEINDPPQKLYHKGNFDPVIFDACLAVVGTRRISNYGKSITRDLAGSVASRGITIVSGFMFGVDAHAHQTALDVGGRTIAVMPCGIDLIKPSGQRKMYEDILKNDGLILSEWEGDFPVHKWTFPRRNRIVTGLSQATLVVEAHPKSGSLISADLAHKESRTVYTPPHALNSPAGDGMKLLIKNHNAQMVYEAQDILDLYGRTDSKNNVDKASFREPKGGIEQNVFRKLLEEPQTTDDLARQLEIPIQELGTILSMMALDGYIYEESGTYHAN